MTQAFAKRLTAPLFIFAPALALLLACSEQAPQSTQGASLDPVVIELAYVRAPVASSTTATAYFTLTNNSEDMRTLVSVQSALASSVEIHEHQHDNGTMRMRQLPSLNINANSSIEFQPGGKHLMLFGFNAANTERDQLTFSFSDGSLIQVSAPIKSLL